MRGTGRRAGFGSARRFRAAWIAGIPLLALVCAAACRSFPKEPTDHSWPTPRGGMVVSEHPLATAAGVQLLERGGNAVDAAVATALALAVVFPTAGNLGGGGFALVVPHEGEPRSLDFRERAPAALSELDFLENGEMVPERSLWTHLAAGVPGSPYGLWELQQELGELPMSAVAAPAIALAREGHAIGPWLAKSLASARIRERLARDRDSLAIYRPDGRWLEEGDLLVQPDLAATLERFARRGPGGFYRGDTAKLLLREVREGGGVLTAEDLENYRPVWREPLVGWFRGSEVITMRPPSSGGLVILQVLAVLDGFPLDAERLRTLERQGTDQGPGLSERALHWWIEALRYAFADRAEHMGDPDYWPDPSAELLSADLIAQRRISIGELANPEVRPWALPAPTESLETTHLSVLDSAGNAVSLTTTLNASFGSGHVVGGAGFLLNNEIDDFAVFPGVPNMFGLVGSRANAIEPGKRPLSSMTPVVVRDSGEAVTLVLGSPGGPRIITAVLEVLLRTQVYGQDLREAIEAPRLHQQWKPAVTSFEPGWDPDVLAGLRARGHEIEVAADRWASVQGIQLTAGGQPSGYSDSRRGGQARAPFAEGPEHERALP